MLQRIQRWYLKLFFGIHTPKKSFHTSIRVKYYLPALIWALIILFLSAKADINLPESIFDFIAMDKLGHFGIYGILTGMLLWGNHKSGVPLDRSTGLKAIIVSGVYGIVMELMQYFFFPGRYFEYLDIIANIIGAICGFALFKYLYIKFT